MSEHATVSIDEAVARAREVISATPSGITTDFDGTLSPIVPRPEDARPLPGVVEALAHLVQKVSLVGVVSGRSVEDLAERCDPAGATLVGNHGLEIRRAGVLETPKFTDEERERLAAARSAAAASLGAGTQIEDKRGGFAIHYRNSPDPEVTREAILALSGSAEFAGLSIKEGKRVAEVRLVSAVTKGTTIDRLADELALRGLLFLGDDVTDVDAFKHVSARRAAGATTLNVAILGAETPSSVIENADICIDGPESAARLLIALADE